MTTALVTGGAGFIGSHLVERLLQQGCYVFVLDDFSAGSERNLPVDAPRLRIIHDSVLNVTAHKDTLSGVDCVFHLAALISSHDSLVEPEPYLNDNIVGLLRIIELCRGLRSPRVVFASSSTVYGNSTAVERSESDAVAPVTAYALTKLAGEHLLHMYREDAGYDDVTLRLFNVYGPRQNRNHPYANVTCKFSWAAAAGAPVVLYGDGHQTRDFVYVDDVVDVMLQVATRRTKNRLFNVGTGTSTSVGELLQIAERIGGRVLEVEQRPPWKNDIRAIRAKTDRLREDIGVIPVTPIAQGLRRTIGYFKEQLEPVGRPSCSGTGGRGNGGARRAVP